MERERQGGKRNSRETRTSTAKVEGPGQHKKTCSIGTLGMQPHHNGVHSAKLEHKVTQTQERVITVI